MINRSTNEKVELKADSDVKVSAQKPKEPEVE